LTEYLKIEEQKGLIFGVVIETKIIEKENKRRNRVGEEIHMRFFIVIEEEK
jgi:hypothetical protein